MNSTGLFMKTELCSAGSVGSNPPWLTNERCERFRSLVTLMNIYLVLPVSTAVCEKGFSTMKRIKSDWRTSLSSVQLQRLLFLSVEGPKLQNFNAGLVVEKWWTCSKRQRRPGFNPWESRRCRSEDTEDE
ncbi:hypothetical protein DPEC_G00202080 [Dallia pectoralis]|uniref:Uncharacterized protein n=1 Tax=Dallia pectoralis TaxID=75939 RepID=A0ACC2G9C0_DALPE|nr:hypothetical protein DPEC_G00202080 [Dallia pectoralis]